MRIPSDQHFSAKYLETTAEAMRQLPHEAIDRTCERLISAYHRGAQVFVAGNGGSASLASHFACDLAKSALGKRYEDIRKRFRAISLSDNIALLSAWANDVSYEVVFSEPLRGLAQPRDMLIVISASGNSPNVLRAIEAARELGVETIGLLGFDGGKAKGMVDEPLLVAVADYGIAEAVHGVLTHLITARLFEEVQRTVE